MAQFSYKIAKKIKSDILVGDAWHHRSDALASVAVGVGIIGSAQGFPILDPIFGIIVSLIIIYVGIDLFKKTSNMLIGQAPDEDIVEKIEGILDSRDEIAGFHKVHVHDYGTSKVISLHAEVKNNLKLEEAHQIADDLEEKVKTVMDFPIIIHLEPKEISTNGMISQRAIQNLLENQKDIISFHKIQIIRGGTKDQIKMHIIVDKDMSIEDSHKLCHNVQSNLETTYGSCNVDIHLEPCQKDCMICTLTCDRRMG
jgi:divalent metal cation (Fe/Co/Zn/Cd) transporter